MNKKAYITPDLAVVLVQTQQMIAASDPTTVTATVDDENPATTGWADSRGSGSLWDDED